MVGQLVLERDEFTVDVQYSLYTTYMEQQDPQLKPEQLDVVSLYNREDMLL